MALRSFHHEGKEANNVKSRAISDAGREREKKMPFSENPYPPRMRGTVCSLASGAMPAHDGVNELPEPRAD